MTEPRTIAESISKNYDVGTRFRTNKGVFIIVQRLFDIKGNSTGYKFVKIENPFFVTHNEFEGRVKDKSVTL